MATKKGEFDFPFRQYSPKGDYYILIDELLKWKEKHGKVNITLIQNDF
jgi:hypothetical protein